MSRARVFAEWLIPDLTDPVEIDGFYISCGESDGDQSEGFFPSEPGAVLTFKQDPGGYRVRFECPSRGLEKHRGYWLSPSCPMDVEAHDFGIINGTKKGR